MPQNRSNVTIIEVGPRDGLQNERELLPTETKLAFIRALIAAGHQHIEATAFVSPKWVPQMSDSADVMAALSPELAQGSVSLPVLVPNMKGLERAIEAGAKRVAVVTAASETFNQRNINQSIDASIGGIQDMVHAAASAGVSVRGYLSTVVACPYEGAIAPDKAADIAMQLLATGVDEVSLGDTIGAAGPRQIQTLLSALYKRGGQPEQFALHCHDTYGTALANVYAGFKMGIRTFDASSGGLGGCPYAPGAAGNVATEDVLYLFQTLGVETGINLDKQADASLLIQNAVATLTPGRRLPSKQFQRLLAARDTAVSSHCADNKA